MKILFCLTSILNVGFIVCFSIAQRAPRLSKRYADSTTGNIGCIHMESFEGEYWYTSPGGEEVSPGGVCGLFVIGLPDQLVEITFDEFNIDCKTGLLATVDGWETQGQFFPSDDDHPLPFDMRYNTYCGKKAPKVFLSSQNVALIQYRIPEAGQGFRISLKLLKNREPCNMVTMMEKGIMTLKNYGQRRNCSVSIMYPEQVKMLSMDVGATRETPMQLKETGMQHHCKKRVEGDYAELLTGTGLDTMAMSKVMDVCGLDSRPELMSVPLACGHSVVRLVSSGQYYNSLTFSYSPLSDTALEKYIPEQCIA